MSLSPLDAIAEALFRYGQHDDSCEWLKGHECSCGFQQAKRQVFYHVEPHMAETFRKILGLPKNEAADALRKMFGLPKEQA